MEQTIKLPPILSLQASRPETDHVSRIIIVVVIIYKYAQSEIQEEIVDVEQPISELKATS